MVFTMLSHHFCWLTLSQGENLLTRCRLSSPGIARVAVDAIEAALPNLATASLSEKWGIFEIWLIFSKNRTSRKAEKQNRREKTKWARKAEKQNIKEAEKRKSKGEQRSRNRNRNPKRISKTVLKKDSREIRHPCLFFYPLVI